MIVFYGKGKVWNAFLALCNHLGKECILMDDEDRDDKQLSNAQIIVPTPGVSQLHDVYTIFGNKITLNKDLSTCISLKLLLNQKRTSFR